MYFPFKREQRAPKFSYKKDKNKKVVPRCSNCTCFATEEPTKNTEAESTEADACEDEEGQKDDVCDALNFERDRFYVTVYAYTDFKNAKIIVSGSNIKYVREIS